MTNMRLFVHYWEEENVKRIIPAADAWKISLANICGERKGRPGRNRPYRNMQSTRFDTLPAEIRSMIFAYAYTTFRDYDPWFRFSFEVVDEPLLFSTTPGGEALRKGTILIRLPKRIGQLFVSSSYLQESLPHYIDGIAPKKLSSRWDAIRVVASRSRYLQLVCQCFFAQAEELDLTRVMLRKDLTQCEAYFHKVTTLHLTMPSSKVYWVQSDSTEGNETTTDFHWASAFKSRKPSLVEVDNNVADAMKWGSWWPCNLREALTSWIGSDDAYAELKTFVVAFQNNLVVPQDRLCPFAYHLTLIYLGRRPRSRYQRAYVALDPRDDSVWVKHRTLARNIGSNAFKIVRQRMT